MVPQHQGNLYVDSKKRKVILYRLSIRGISVDSQKEESHSAVPQHQGNLYVDSKKRKVILHRLSIRGISTLTPQKRKVIL